jgi:hypothetical protein
MHSINWEYTKLPARKFADYESARGSRKYHHELVLTREEREKILIDWGVPSHQIAEGVRSALKVKNQRKQTVVNGRKIARLEETIEGASNLVIKALMLKRNQHDQAKILHQCGSQEAPSNKFGTMGFLKRDNSNDRLSWSRHSHGKSIKSVEDSPCYENSNVSGEAAIQYSDIEDIATVSDTYTLGATTLGNNSLSPSIAEIERFYQELELEMFGDELPSMVGHTLEVQNQPADIEEQDANSTSPSVREIEKFHRELELELFGEEAELPSMIGRMLEVPDNGHSNGDGDDSSFASTLVSASHTCDMEEQTPTPIHYQQNFQQIQTQYQHNTVFPAQNTCIGYFQQHQITSRRQKEDFMRLALAFQDSYYSYSEPRTSYLPQHVPGMGRNISFESLFESTSNSYHRHDSAANGGEHPSNSNGWYRTRHPV